MPPPPRPPAPLSPRSTAQRAMLSERATAALKPALSYGAAFSELKDAGLWSAGAGGDPGGSIVLGVAENRVSADLVHERLKSLGPFPPEMLTYQAWRGIPELGQAIKRMLESTFMKARKARRTHARMRVYTCGCLLF